MEGGEVTNWANVPFLPVTINFQTFIASFDVVSGEWQKKELKDSHESPELKRMQEDLENLRIKNVLNENYLKMLISVM